MADGWAYDKRWSDRFIFQLKLIAADLVVAPAELRPSALVLQHLPGSGSTLIAGEGSSRACDDMKLDSRRSSMVSSQSGHRNVHATAATPRRLVLRKEVS